MYPVDENQLSDKVINLNEGNRFDVKETESNNYKLN